MHYTASCNTESGAPEDGRDHRPKHVELIGIINKPLLLRLVGVYVIYNNDARSNTYEVHMLIHYHFWQRQERQKTELPVSLNTKPRKRIVKGKIKSSPVLTTAVCEMNQSLEDYDVTSQAYLLSALIWWFA